MIVINMIHRIGDFLGTVPAMIELGKQSTEPVYFVGTQKSLFELIPKKYNLRSIYEAPHGYVDPDVRQLDLHGAFDFAAPRGYHMTQAFFQTVGLEVPAAPIRPELDIPEIDFPTFDYVLAPFSLSLPPEQKWQQEKWVELVRRMPDKKFVLLGDCTYDDEGFIHEPNCEIMFNHPWREVAHVMKNAKVTLSVVTGISHFAYAIGARNIQFFNQGRWGQNPNGRWLSTFIPDITVDEVMQVLPK